MNPNSPEVSNFSRLNLKLNQFSSNIAWEVVGHTESVKIVVILNPTGYMLTSSGFTFESFEVYSIDSSKKISKVPEVLNFNWLFLELNRFICN